MTERPKPYIGISGVNNAYSERDMSQQQAIREHFASQGLEDSVMSRRLALGVKAVHKTQFLDRENKYGKEWYPVGEDAFSGVMDGGGIAALKVAQMYFDPELVHNSDYRDAFIARVCRRGAAWLNAVQFDMLPWHDDEAVFTSLEKLRNKTNHSIILQAHSEAMRTLGPDGVTRRLGRYAGMIDYVLFDASHGKGLRMNPGALLPFLESAYSSSKLDEVGFGVAGGLNASVVREDLPLLLECFADLSWDAEAQLHPANTRGKRPLDMELVKNYLAASGDVLKRYN